MLRIDFVTLFPEQVLPGLRHSILDRAEKAGRVAFSAVNPRDFATDNHRTVDDSPYGGGPGMVMKPEPLRAALYSLHLKPEDVVIATEPTGKRFTQKDARSLSAAPRLVFLCGHYEGIDHRITERYATHSFSIGDFVLTGGELAAMVMADAVVRLLPGVLGAEESLLIDSHGDGLLSAPQFTRPESFEGLEVPSVLRSGDHKAIERWRRRASLRLTRELRPDLFCSSPIAKSDLDLL